MDTSYIIDKLVSLGVPLSDAGILGAVAKGESGYRPTAEAITPKEHSVGLFQINTFAHGKKLEKWTGSKDPAVWYEWLKVPDNNIFAASQVYHSQGLGAWSVYKSGKYKQWLGQNFTVGGGAAPVAGADEPDDMTAPAEKYSSRWWKYTKLMLSGKWKEAEEYRSAWPVGSDPVTGQPVVESDISTEATKNVEEGNAWIKGKVQQGFWLVAGLVVGAVGIVLVAKNSALKLVKEG